MKHVVLNINVCLRILSSTHYYVIIWSSWLMYYTVQSNSAVFMVMVSSEMLQYSCVSIGTKPGNIVADQISVVTGIITMRSNHLQLNYLFKCLIKLTALKSYKALHYWLFVWESTRRFLHKGLSNAESNFMSWCHCVIQGCWYSLKNWKREL